MNIEDLNPQILQKTENLKLRLALSELTGRNECSVNGLEGQKQRKRLVKELKSAISCVPLSNPLVFGINEERHTTNL